MTLNEFLRLHRAANDNLRLGQRFIDTYYPRLPSTSLFYETDEKRALATIRELLTDFQYGE